MNNGNSIEVVNTSGLSDQTKFRLNEINNVKNYFNPEIQQRKIMRKKLSKDIAAFDYIDKTFFIWNKWRRIYHLLCKCYWCSCRNNKCKFYSCVFLTTVVIKTNLKNNKKQKEGTQ